jgi:hypothetical protein
MDITLRLEPIILDIERTREPILIVGKPVDLFDVSLHPLSSCCHLLLNSFRLVYITFLSSPRHS